MLSKNNSNPFSVLEAQRSEDFSGGIASGGGTGRGEIITTDRNSRSSTGGGRPSTFWSQTNTSDLEELQTKFFEHSDSSDFVVDAANAVGGANRNYEGRKSGGARTSSRNKSDPFSGIENLALG